MLSTTLNHLKKRYYGVTKAGSFEPEMEIPNYPEIALASQQVHDYFKNMSVVRRYIYNDG